MAEIKSLSGRVQLSDEVIATIAGASALEVEGVYGTGGTISGDIAHAFGVKNAAKGVRLEVDGDEVVIDLNLVIKFGYKIISVSEEAQRRVKSALETMTGLKVTCVNINITGVAAVKEKKNALTPVKTRARKPKKNNPLANKTAKRRIVK